MDGSGARNLLITVIVLCYFWPRFCVAQSDIQCECGPFGICDPQETPICRCLQGFYPRNSQEWDSGNWSSGCLRRARLNCGEGGNSDDGFLTLEITLFTGSSERSFEIDEDQCGNRCLRNCSCLAYGFQPGNGCMLWTGSLTNIKNISMGSDSSIHIRVSKSELGIYFI